MRKPLAGLLLSAGLASAAHAQPVTGNLRAENALRELSGTTVAASARLNIGADGVLIDNFKQVGDADDTQSLIRCETSGTLPCKLNARTYTMNGQMNFTGNFSLTGVQGVSAIVRTSALTSGTWIAWAGPTTEVQGVTFNADASTSAYHVNTTVLSGKFYYNSFKNGDAMQVFGASLNTEQRFEFVGNEFTGMSFHGLYLQQVENVLIEGNYSHDNTSDGILISYTNNVNDPAAININVIGNHLFNNAVGIRVGNYNTQAGPIGPTDPVAAQVVISGNQAYNNTTYGFAIDCDSPAITGNIGTGNGTLSNLGGAFLINSRYATFTGNIAYNNPYYDVDGGGSINAIYANNVFGPATVGVNLGAGQTTDVTNNRFYGITGDNVTARSVDGSLGGIAFPIFANTLSVVGNKFDISSLVSTNVWGVHAWDGTQDIIVKDNDFYATAASGILPANAVRLVTNNDHVSGNRWNGNRIYQIAMGVVNAPLVIPTMFDQVEVTDAGNGITGLASSDAAALNGGVTWLTNGNAGTGYTTATATITGGGGTGATATVSLNGGSVVGYHITNTGTGYTTIPTVTVTGDGTGATATANVGVPWPPERQMRLILPVGGKLYNGATTTYGSVQIPFIANQNSLDYGGQAVTIDLEYLSNGFNYIATSWPYSSPQNHVGSFAGTGNAGSAAATNSGIVAGLNNVITAGANQSMISSGSGNNISAQGGGTFIGAGASNLGNGQNGDIPGGTQANLQGREFLHCHASGKITGGAAAGDEQTCQGEMWQTTTAASAVRLTADGAAARNTASGTGNCLNIPVTGSAYALHILFVANDITTPANRYFVWENAEMDIGATAGSLRVNVEGTPVTASFGTTTGTALAQAADSTNVCLDTEWTPPTSNTDTWNVHETIFSSEVGP